MPELPEVEVVRRGLERHAVGRHLNRVQVWHPRAARNQPGGGAALEQALEGATLTGAHRRGKFLWLSTDRQEHLLVHLGMSGQMLIKNHPESHPHLRASARLSPVGSSGVDSTGPNEEAGQEQATWLYFIDQRTFGYWRATPADEQGVPLPVAHIARDLLDPVLDIPALARRIKARPTEIKRLLLNQEVVSGIGNIYADEMLWAARLHGRQRASRVSLARLEELLWAGREVMERALEQGGTSFDSLYVNVNGESGYFDVSLHAYGRHGQPCHRCGAEMRREAFMNRSSHFCPECQRPR
ncbi:MULTISPECIES: bifunctional DNA-formamidopyrimidine glycosylase/DNA-(apurinic or apyrimidinic site) lyase [unclassified Corynebacterium]|uniref:bifunctional DNA-formamidopyrimidine glycosylase/DNA-(apurinic or apyrimidinic site) lyase n=1 Tax=unclassified Corynebacterium TaxID=2624378 RepID=UPI0029CA891C|nr:MULTISPECIES: bifunctional DNA-formamidopyrimidine glycosylase/DNA-(apurinic or apyrimidinic site) lyase [unclassified Corynebacterium]WPF65370.1 bifunctional DNA-formamidopyrimidine glycosylase/DNA-(apurinic or apyrimidinic site) lyase [Corynebacterium sp. 22KM0430]WPF67865.1 bifunctional DNA-formamidopyrimidine glycosylase/DNA-(apurinic or apyrimidinic site) lyase [Corynebacterium sp. 21KM1197]